MRVLYDEKKQKIPVKFWLDIDKLEHSALEQALNLSRLPFAYHHVSIMPDSHTGYGMPIGGVLATQGVVIPNAVGVDIGCGMCAVKTSIKNISLEQLKTIMGKIREIIPVGFNKHKEPQDKMLMPNWDEGNIESKYNFTMIDNKRYCYPISPVLFDKALYQLGTLGGGNHFIEIQKGDDGYIWIMIHSGSRNLGKQVADHYNKIAKALNKKWYSVVPTSYDLAFLPLDSDEGKDYIKEMEYCVEFALANRKLMMGRILNLMALQNLISIGELPDLVRNMINIAHNYASLENHFGKNVVVHRKGATLARKDIIEIIPGSQGTKSYIVKGKGNPESFYSCSHGAGRIMSRSKAKQVLNLEEEQNKLVGIVHSIRNTKDLDEASGAYKDIDEVMKNQADLIEIVTELTPLGVVKG